MDYLLSILLVVEDLLYTLYFATSVSQHRVDPYLCSLMPRSYLAGLLLSSDGINCFLCHGGSTVACE